jgi:DNA-entry nuclease
VLKELRISMKNPSEGLVWKLIDEGGIWGELGLKQGQNLNYKQGSIVLDQWIGDIQLKFNEIVKSDYYAKNDECSNCLLIQGAKSEGGYAIIGKDTICRSKNRKKGQGESSKRRYRKGFHSGHILARQLVWQGLNSNKKHRDVVINYNNIKNIYPQTPWSNGGSAPRKRGRGKKQAHHEEVRNQTYYENYVVNHINDNSGELFYRVKLVYGKNASELVPRGVRIQAIKIISLNGKMELGENLFNVFIPNVMKTSLIDYTNRKERKCK